jgi:hypothetical protein
MCSNPHLILVSHRSFVNGELQSRRLTVRVVIPPRGWPQPKPNAVRGWRPNNTMSALPADDPTIPTGLPCSCRAADRRPTPHASAKMAWAAAPPPVIAPLNPPQPE